jgi:hypothetical protein
MKKLKLSLSQMKGVEILGREDLKKVTGGSGGSGGGYECNIPSNPGCGDYEGQTTYYCGCRVNGDHCYLDICYCSGTPVPGGCEVEVICEDYL